MATSKQSGFTIVEVMLFLGITGLVMAFMLNGVSSSLNQRRYQDAANSLLAYVQSQYNLVANVNNTRTTVGDGLEAACGDTTVAGTSDCTVVGRVLHASPGGETTTSKITSTWVIATADVAKLSSGATLTAANLQEGKDVDTYDMQWGTQLVEASDHAAALTFSILIARSPTNGIIHTYINPGTDKSPADIAAASDNLTQDFKLCVDPVGLLGGSADPAGTMIQHGATNTSGVLFVGQGQCT
jgi:type II secretory pathway pseudopilin PulG